jgi:imidazolonepropionase-like amidohydrolase
MRGQSERASKVFKALRVVLAVLAMLAVLWPPAPVSAAMVINEVTIVDGTGRPALAGRTVLIEGDRIVAIRDHAIAAPAGATLIDGRGKFLIPGMADTHIHLPGGRDAHGGPAMDMDTGRRMLQGYLYNGVTFVCDVANYDKYIFAIRDAERSGRMLSPRVFAVGYPMAWTGGYGSGGVYPTLSNYEEGVKAMDALLAQKPDLVKFLYAPHVVNNPNELPAFDPTTLHRLIMYANERGFRTTIHAVEGVTQRAAVEAGIDALAHPVYETETDDKLAPLIATKGLPVSTSLAVLANIFRLAESPSDFDSPPFRALLTDTDLAFFRDAERARYLRTNMAAWGRQAFGYASRNDRKLYDAGATLALGTDRTIGAYVPMELELIVGLGIPPLQALRIATLNAAIYLHAADRMGSVEEGKLADLVLLNDDPTKDIDNVRKISAVILGGKVVDRAKLDLPINHRGE